MTCRKFLIAFIALALSLTVHAQEDPVVAEVNGKKISKSELEKAFKQNMMFVSDKIVSKEKVLYDMINRELGIAKAKENNLSKEPKVRKKMNDILYHAQISRDLEDKLKEIEVTEQDVKRYYKNHKEYRTAQILFRVRVTPTEEEYKAALKKALEVYNQLKSKPDKFAELANQYSQASTAKNGGDMGFQPAVRLAPEYFKAIRGKAPGHITSPVRSQFGYHIIKVLAVKDYDDINKSLYKKIVYDQKRDAILKEYFEDMRDKAKISINKKYLE